MIVPFSIFFKITNRYPKVLKSAKLASLSSIIMVVVKVLVVLVAIASYVSIANGICCDRCSHLSPCPDGTKCSFFECCGTGPCNIFCCNCDGVCRESSFLQRTLPWAKIAADNLDVAIERFGQFDTDQDGAIDIHELKQADVSVPTFVRESEFERIDVNRDGKITIKEFDEDAGRSIKEKSQHAVRNTF